MRQQLSHYRGSAPILLFTQSRKCEAQTSISLPVQAFFTNSGLLGGNLKFASKKRVSLQVSYGDSFLIALGLRGEMRITRLRKGSAGWPAVPAAEEEHYVGLCCLQGTLVFPNTLTEQLSTRKGYWQLQ